MISDSQHTDLLPHAEKYVQHTLEENMLESDITQFTALVRDLYIPLASITDLCRKVLTLPQIPKSNLRDADNTIADAQKLDELIQKLYDFSNNILSFYPDIHSADVKNNPKIPNDAFLFLQSVFAAIRQNISDPNLSPSYIAARLNLSTRNLYRKLDDTCKKSPAELIRSCRFNYVCHLLLTSSFTIAEIIYKSGFVSKAAFFKSFHEKYHCTPKEYRRNFLVHPTEPSEGFSVSLRQDR
jgi:AraC-like DNA-binding protein